MICVCEREILLYHLHLYARRVHPGIPFHEQALRQTLEQAGIKAMRQLFALSTEQRRVLAGRVLRALPEGPIAVLDRAA
jgi:hypothetical protein